MSDEARTHDTYRTALESMNNREFAEHAGLVESLSRAVCSYRDYIYYMDNRHHRGWGAWTLGCVPSWKHFTGLTIRNRMTIKTSVTYRNGCQIEVGCPDRVNNPK